ncbi:MAG: ribonuclease HII [Lentisphaeria bacterium]|jgi:ribonuclease HII
MACRRTAAARQGEVDLLAFEREAAAGGFARIAGVDEAGRGPLAGPVVAAAVVLPATGPLPPVFDSKQLTARRREELAAALEVLPGIAFAIAAVPAAEIDRLNILKATHLAMRQALEQLDPAAEFALVDGLPVPGLPVPSRAIVKGDARSASIAAASILAKVYRDRYMAAADARHPGYGFGQHKGYGTAAHLAALERLGPSPEHRLSFAPVALAAGLVPRQPELPFARPAGS